MNSDLKATAEFLKTCTRVSIFSHVNPDGDAIGSSCALAKGLASLGVKADIYNVSPIPKAYYFLPKAKEIKLFSGTEELAPVIIVADCANLKRAELDKYPESLAGKIVVEIDHHVGNEYFGKYNYVGRAFGKRGAHGFGADEYLRKRFQSQAYFAEIFICTYEFCLRG